MSILIVILVFGVIILVHETGHLFAAKKAGIKVEVFSLGMGKKLIGMQIGETEYRLSLVPFGGYCKMAGEDPEDRKGNENEFGSKPVGHRFWVIIAGSLMNYIFAFLLFWVIFMAGVPTMSNKIGQVLADYPAQKAGIAIGDRVNSINGAKIEYWEDLLSAIQKYSEGGKDLELSVERNGANMQFRVKPDVHEVKNIFGQVITRPMLGVGPASEITAVRYGIVKSSYYAGKHLFELSGMTYKMMWMILTRGMPVKDTMSGPIGIAFFIKQAASTGIIPLLVVMAHISMALAIFNMLPFPVLDGGHAVLLLIEKIRGRALSMKIQSAMANAAVVLLIALAVFISFHDIMRFTPLGKGKVFQEATGKNVSEP
ncbi:MAG: RIP metalloprotease RseP [Candidatus Omnitrophica bacterium]|nr:RIP metalloprotease RseP [Candidatus Omnitrophota bacterium]